MVELTEKMLTGDIASAARLITMIENNREDAARIVKAIFPHTGRAYLVGVTGSPGAGKSTLISEMIRVFRDRGQTVGVIAVDATSPFSGGAVLGDRIRMQKYEGEGVFIRSMATRGNLGGLSRAARDVSYVMDAMGMNIIIVETVGVGQVEVEISRTAYSTVVVLAPGMGDSIQAMKAGIMEVGDIFVVNKADREGADDTFRDIEGMLRYKLDGGSWQPEIYKATATKGEGITELLDGLEKHRRYLNETSLIRKKVYGKEQLLDLIKERVEKRVFDNRSAEEYLARYVEKIVMREIDPYTVSDIILEKMGL